MIQKIADLPQQQQVMLAVPAVGLLFLFWWYVLSPMGAEVEMLSNRIQELTAEVQRGQEVERRLPQFQQEVEELEGRLGELRQVLPDEKETAEIVRQVEELAVESNLEIRSFTPQPTVRSGFYDDWPIRISLEGNYNNLGLFFQKVAQFRRLINIDNISIQGLAEGSPNRTIAATCTATTFVFAE